MRAAKRAAVPKLEPQCSEAVRPHPSVALRPVRGPRPCRAAGSLARGLAVLLGAALLLTAAPRPSQAVTFLEQIERLRLIAALLLDLRPGQAPLVPGAGQADATLELIPTPGFNTQVGGKQEPIDPPPAFPRLRLRYLSARGLMLGVTASPAVEVRHYSAAYVGGEAGLRHAFGALHAELRGFAIAGQLRGPFTQTGTRDTLRFSNRGADVRGGVPLGALALYAGAGRGRTTTELAVQADGARIGGDNGYTYWLAGAAWAGDGWRLTLEQNVSEDFLRHLILAASRRW